MVIKEQAKMPLDSYSLEGECELVKGEVHPSLRAIASCSQLLGRMKGRTNFKALDSLVVINPLP